MSRDVALPMSTTIAHVKLLCERLFGVNVNLQALTLVRGAGEHEDLGADASLDLIHHNLENGAVVYVTQADPQVVWSHCAGTTVEVVPAFWLLPPESRPELSALMAM